LTAGAYKRATLDLMGEHLFIKEGILANWTIRAIDDVSVLARLRAEIDPNITMYCRKHVQQLII
jgi:hypothetical protein